MPELFLDAGPGGYLTALVGALGLAFAAAAAASSPRRALVLAGVVLACGASALVIGATTSLSERKAFLQASAHVNPADRATILAAGEQASSAGSRLGLWCGLPVLAMGLGLTWRQFSKTGEVA